MKEIYMNTIDFKNTNIVDWYVSNYKQFENNLNGHRNIPFYEIRKNAISNFEKLGFPTTKNEEWKYTNISPILKQEFVFSKPVAKIEPAMIERFKFSGMDENVLVFLNGRYSKEFSSLKNLEQSIIIEGLTEAQQKYPQLVNQHLAKYADFNNETFTALNTAFTFDGLFIYIPQNIIVESPIHLLYLSDESDEIYLSNHRNLIVIEENSQAKFVDTYNHVAENTYFLNLVTEIFVGKHALVEHVKIQDESPRAFHISNCQIHQERESNFSHINIDLGASLVRNNLNIRLNGEQVESHLIGFYLGKGTQHIDNHTLVDHAYPNCYSNELYKGILDVKSHGVFNGKILVRKDAQKTNAYQDNKNLLLTDDATINTKPQLEIFADDVKCSHGATVGQLDEEALFYLRSRGINMDKALSILRYAFAKDVFDYIKIESVSEKLDQILHQRM
jgi:Fe-S cluster assembly protein SufD